MVYSDANMGSHAGLVEGKRYEIMQICLFEQIKIIATKRLQQSTKLSWIHSCNKSVEVIFTALMSHFD